MHMQDLYIALTDHSLDVMLGKRILDKLTHGLETQFGTPRYNPKTNTILFPYDFESKERKRLLVFCGDIAILCYDRPTGYAYDIEGVNGLIPGADLVYSNGAQVTFEGLTIDLNKRFGKTIKDAFEQLSSMLIKKDNPCEEVAENYGGLFRPEQYVLPFGAPEAGEVVLPRFRSPGIDAIKVQVEVENEILKSFLVPEDKL